jgi:glycosyltransferase involved in cell wall biosynthesis
VPRPIALDGTLLDAPITGIAQYTQELGRGLERTGAQVERWGAPRSGDLPRRRQSRTAWTLATLPGLLAERSPGLYHAVSNFNLPLTRVPGVPLVLTVHDAVPLELPETVSTAFRWQFRLWLSRSLQLADRIIFVSQAAADSVRAHFDFDAAKARVIWHGVDHVEVATDRVTEQWIDAQGFTEPWVLYAGALDARKNVELVLRAMERLHDGGRRATLVLAGQRWFGAGRIEQGIERLKARGVDVRPLGYLATPVFYALMRRAGVFVFPSKLEGFGFPPLEAMRLAVPTIVSSSSSLPEITGGAALTVGVDDAAGLATHLDRLLTHRAEREALGAQGAAWAARFTWAETAKQTLGLYREVADV